MTYMTYKEELRNAIAEGKEAARRIFNATYSNLKKDILEHAACGEPKYIYSLNDSNMIRKLQAALAEEGIVSDITYMYSTGIAEPRTALTVVFKDNE